MNKLSELSKPVMYVVRTLDGSVASVKAHNYTAPKGFTSAPLYSQEYVSALIERAKAAEQKCHDRFIRINELEKKLIDAGVRIAELEGTRFITWPGNMFAPVLARIKVDVKRRDGSVSVGQSGGNVVWYHQNRPDDVIAFALTVEGDEQ